MPDFKQIQIPEALLQQYLKNDKEPELFVCEYISMVRPDPRDLDRIVALVVTTHAFVRDARDMIRALEANPETVLVSNSEVELPVLGVVRCETTGVHVNSMLEISADGDDKSTGLPGGVLQFKRKRDEIN